MAESQEQFQYDQALVTALSASLSVPRLAPYLAASANDPVYAFQRYLWNARLAKSLLFPLQVVEVTVRNAVHRTLSGQYGPDWITNPPAGLLTPESETSRQNGLRRLALAGKAAPTPDEVVAALTFDFWSNLFREDYDGLWSPTTTRTCFPNLAAPYDWRFVQSRARRVNALRNRIAHHEPIWNAVDLGLDFERCLDLIRLVSNETGRWVQRHNTFRTIHRSPPLATPSLPGLNLTSVTFETPVVLEAAEPITDAIRRVAGARPQLGLIQREGDWIVATPCDLLAAITTASEAAGGYVDLNALTVADVAPPPRRLATATRDMTTGDLLGRFFPPNMAKANRPAHVLLIDAASQEPVGLVERPTVRYR